LAKEFHGLTLSQPVQGVSFPKIGMITRYDCLRIC
jgi:hypothetical protein